MIKMDLPSSLPSTQPTFAQDTKIKFGNENCFLQKGTLKILPCIIRETLNLDSPLYVKHACSHILNLLLNISLLKRDLRYLYRTCSPNKNKIYVHNMHEECLTLKKLFPSRLQCYS